MTSMHGLEETDGGMFKQGSDVMSGSSDQLGAEKSVDDGINVIRWYIDLCLLRIQSYGLRLPHIQSSVTSVA